MGIFNPPHKGHISVANYLVNHNIVDKVIIVPTGNYWDKQNVIETKHRINMLKFFEKDNIIIDTKNTDYKYTYELMRKLKKDYPKDALYMIIGADNIVNFDKWEHYQELLNYPIIIMNRDGIDISKYTKNYQGDFIIVNDSPRIDVSSTISRKDINSKYLDKKVIDYIRKNHLYEKE